MYSWKKLEVQNLLFLKKFAVCKSFAVCKKLGTRQIVLQIALLCRVSKVRHTPNNASLPWTESLPWVFCSGTPLTSRLPCALSTGTRQRADLPCARVCAHGILEVSGSETLFLITCLPCSLLGEGSSGSQEVSRPWSGLATFLSYHCHCRDG